MRSLSTIPHCRTARKPWALHLSYRPAVRRIRQVRILRRRRSICCLGDVFGGPGFGRCGWTLPPRAKINEAEEQGKAYCAANGDAGYGA